MTVYDTLSDLFYNAQMVVNSRLDKIDCHYKNSPNGWVKDDGTVAEDLCFTENYWHADTNQILTYTDGDFDNLIFYGVKITNSNYQGFFLNPVGLTIRDVAFVNVLLEGRKTSDPRSFWSTLHESWSNLLVWHGTYISTGDLPHTFHPSNGGEQTIDNSYRGNLFERLEAVDVSTYENSGSEFLSNYYILTTWGGYETWKPETGKNRSSFWRSGYIYTPTLDIGKPNPNSPLIGKSITRIFLESH
jgi:hypothetical protein